MNPLLAAIAVSAPAMDIPARLAQADFSWTDASADFYDAAFLGDGVQGATVLRDSQESNTTRLLLGHYRAITYRAIPNWEYCESRVFAGNVLIRPRGTAQSRPVRTEMASGRVMGSIRTDRGEVTWRTFAERRHHVIAVIASGTGEEASPELAVRPEWGITPRIYADRKPLEEVAAYLPPKPTQERNGEIDYVINPMATRGAHVVASRRIRGRGGVSILLVAIATSGQADRTEAIAEAKRDATVRLKAAYSEGLSRLESRHLAWWGNYWKKGGIALPDDPYWEAFWYRQLYKFASASSENESLVIDTCGPWIWNSGWAAVWWNLNVQLSYMPAYGANRLEVGRSLIRGIERHVASGALRRNAGDQPGIMIGRSTTYEGNGSWGDEISNLTWALHNVWRDYAYSQDHRLGRRLFPILKESVAYMVAQLREGPDGTLHARPARSPEYNEQTLTPDANYVLMTVDWGLRALLELDEDLGIRDPERANWNRTLARLTPFPTDANGFRVSAELGFDHSHRHYSHLLAVYPFHTVHPEQGRPTRQLIQRSVDRWLSLKGGHAGYTFTGGAAMLATLGDGDRALSVLDELRPRLTPNTMYHEGSPVVETPLSAVDSLNYFLLQSWGGVLRAFPAVPSKWKRAAFHNLRAEGAFLVSGEWENGTVERLTIRSEAGRRCRLRNPWPNESIRILHRNREVRLVESGEDVIFATQIGETYSVSTHDRTSP